MQLVLATLENLDEIMGVIEDGRLALKELGLPQWQDDYPNATVIQQDIEEKISYILLENNIIIGTVVLDSRGEPVYDTLVGSWQNNDKPYLTIHRMAVKRGLAHQGIGTVFLQLMERIALEQQIEQIRLDTHKDNHVMQRVAEKNGYHYAGTVNYGIDFDCVAFDKIVTKQVT